MNKKQIKAFPKNYSSKSKPPLAESIEKANIQSANVLLSVSKSKIPKLAPHEFSYERSARRQGITWESVCPMPDKGKTAEPWPGINGWTLIGYLKANKLPCLAKEDGRAYMYEHKDGRRVWFHDCDATCARYL